MESDTAYRNFEPCSLYLLNIKTILLFREIAHQNKNSVRA